MWSNIRTPSQRMVAESKDMERDTQLRWRITYPAPCWAELFIPRSFIKTRAISIRERGVSDRARCTRSLRQSSPGVVVGARYRNYSRVLGHFSAAAISNLYYPASDRGASLVLFNRFGWNRRGCCYESDPRISSETDHHACSQRRKRPAIARYSSLRLSSQAI